MDLHLLDKIAASTIEIPEYTGQKRFYKRDCWKDVIIHGENEVRVFAGLDRLWTFLTYVCIEFKDGEAIRFCALSGQG